MGLKSGASAEFVAYACVMEGVGWVTTDHLCTILQLRSSLPQFCAAAGGCWAAAVEAQADVHMM